MTGRLNKRNLPPLSSKLNPKEEIELAGERPKNKKKKATKEQSELETPRRRQRRQSASTSGAERSEVDGATSTTEGTPTKSKAQSRKPPHISITYDDQETRNIDSMNEESVEYHDTFRDSTTSKGKVKVQRKRKLETGTSRETLTAENDDGEKVKKRKKKKKKKKKHGLTLQNQSRYGIGLVGELELINDDVVDVTDTHDKFDAQEIAAPTIRSEPLSTIFIEQKKGFKAADKVVLARRMEEAQRKLQQLPALEPANTTLEFGLSTHTVFKAFTLFCHGLFAGFSFWHIVMVFTMLTALGYKGFLGYYHILAQPVQSLYFLLFVFCTVSAFDRYDLCSLDKRFVKRAVTLQNGAIACVFYMVGIFISLFTAPMDDKLSLFVKFPKLWEDDDILVSELNTWRILNAVRGCTAIVGWFIIALNPTFDRLYSHLHSATETAIGMDLKKSAFSSAA